MKERNESKQELLVVWNKDCWEIIDRKGKVLRSDINNLDTAHDTRTALETVRVL